MLSSKPASGVYPSQYEKVTAYVRIRQPPGDGPRPHRRPPPPAQRLPGGRGRPPLPLPRHRDLTGRPGAAQPSSADERLTIVGLGGTGGYVLDQVAKTPVTSILLIDGDIFDNHNAFRAPGAPPSSSSASGRTKVDYFADLYGNMHTGITTEAAYITEDNLSLLDEATFVFLCMDDAAAKH